MIFLVAVLAFGLITALIAHSKGHNGVLWFLFGAGLFIVALPCALFLKPRQEVTDARALSSGDSKKCPFCAELIRADAHVCRYCGRDLEAPAPPPA